MRLPRNPPRHPRLNRRLLLQRSPSTRRLRFRGIFLQRLHRDSIVECRSVRCVEEDPVVHQPSIQALDQEVSTGRREKINALGHNRIVRPLRRLHRLFPPRRTQTPLAAVVETGDLAQVVAAGGGEVEEFFR